MLMTELETEILQRENNMIPVDDIKDPKSDYFKEALSWQEERYELATKQRRAGWFVAFIAGTIALMLAMALMFLTPLKSVSPYVIYVNTITGETRVQQSLKKGKLTQSEALTKYWIIKYVRARTSYDRQDLEQKYEMVKMMSDKKEFVRYAKVFDPKRADSPYQTYGEKITLETKVKSISFLDENTASIRLDLIEHANDKATTTPWVVTMSYQFTLEPRTEEERFENPLGFQGTKWRIDAEVETGE